MQICYKIQRYVDLFTLKPENIDRIALKHLLASESWNAVCHAQTMHARTWFLMTQQYIEPLTR